MKKKTLLIIVFMLTLLFTLVNCEKNAFEIQSNAFRNNERIPDRYCRGNVDERQNISLPFNWINAPEDTKSFALTIHDISANNFLHWAVLNIPADYNEIAENASRNFMPIGSIELNNQFRAPGYGGPEPPRGRGIHEYVVTLYALNISEINNISGYRSYAQLSEILNEYTIAKTEIIGLFSAD